MKNISRFFRDNKLFISIVLFVVLKEFFFNKSLFGVAFKRAIGLDFCIILFTFFLVSLFYRRNNLYIAYVLDLIVSILLLANSIFYRTYGDFITLGLLREANQMSAVKTAIFSIFRLSDVLYIIDLIILPVFIKRFGKKTNDKRLLTAFIGVLCSFVVLCVSFIYVIHRGSDVITSQFSIVELEHQTGVLGSDTIQVYNYVKNNINIGDISPKQVENINSQMNVQNISHGSSTGKNLIMIQVESLQEFVINSTYNGKEITPNLNRLRNESAFFNNCYYQTGIGHTSDAELLTNTSLYPIQNGSAYIMKSNNTYNSISESLKNLGYDTLAFHGNSGNFWNRTAMYNNFKFDEFYDMKKLNNGSLSGMGITDESLFSQASDIMKTSKQPFYSFLVTLTSHAPFIVDNDFCETNNTLERYFNAINYTDKSIGMFIDKLQQSGILNNSILIIYGDHNGITINDKALLSQYVEKDLNQDYLWQQYQKVPMIIRFPNGDNKGTYTKSVGQVDVFSTVSNLLGINDVKTFGQDMFSKEDNLVVLRDNSYVFGDEYFDSKLNATFNINTGKEIGNDSTLINRTTNQLMASDDIFKYNYFKQSKMTNTLAKK